MKDERGYALILGAISVLVLTATVLTTLAVGDAVYQKMKMQDAADAQAYSTAVRMARAYNYFAYTNRAMTVHYNAMLTLIAYVSHAYYLKNTIGEIANYAQYIPYIGFIFAAVKAIIDAWYYAADMMAIVGVPILEAMNLGLWASQEAMLTATYGDVLASPANEALKTDPNVNVNSVTNPFIPGLGGQAVSYLNAQDFLHPIKDAASSALPFGSCGDPFGAVCRAKMIGKTNLTDTGSAPNYDGVTEYRFAMNEIVNSGRREWTAIGKGPLLIGRRWSLDFCVIAFAIHMHKDAAGELRSYYEGWDGNRVDQAHAWDRFLFQIETPCWSPFGTTTTTIIDYRVAVGADIRGGYHKQWLNGNYLGTGSTHHYFTGISPFVMARPGFTTPEANHFNQPCNAYIATKDMMSPKMSKAWNFYNKMPLQLMTRSGYTGAYDHIGKYDLGWRTVETKGDVAKFMSESGGQMALAVGRAIYHRPAGTNNRLLDQGWREEPNFFNPLWEARLAPVRSHWDVGLLTLIVPALNLFIAADAVNY